MDLLDIYVGAPCVTQSDSGTENFNVACAHTHIRHKLDPSLSGSIQHQWTHGHSNIKPGQMWSRFRRMWAPGFESLLQKGISQQWYDDVDVADRYVLVCHIVWASKLTGIVTDWFFVGWPSLGCRRQLIRTYTTTTRAAEGQIVAMSYQMKSRMPCSKTRKS
jgi:hypothetical protein